MDYSKCRYCYRKYSLILYPYRYKCSCIVCAQCLGVLKESKLEICPFCGNQKVFNPKTSVKYESFFQSLVENDPSFIEENKNIQKLDQEINEKLQCCEQVLQALKTCESDIKTIQGVFDDLEEFKTVVEDRSDLNDLSQAVEFARRYEIYKKDSFNERYFGRLTSDKSVIRFERIMNKMFINNEQLKLASPNEVVWLGLDVEFSTMSQKSVVSIRNSGTESFSIKGVGIVMDCLNKKMRRGEIRISKASEMRREVVFNKEWVQLFTKDEFLFEVDLGCLEIKAGSEYLFEISEDLQKENLSKDRVFLTTGTEVRFGNFEIQIENKEEGGCRVGYLRVAERRT